jgi:hypothetical protein
MLSKKYLASSMRRRGPYLVLFRRLFQTSLLVRDFKSQDQTRVQLTWHKPAEFWLSPLAGWNKPGEKPCYLLSPLETKYSGEIKNLK